MMTEEVKSRLDQCTMEYKLPDGKIAEYGMDTLCCVRNNGHDGHHFDHLGRWSGKQVVPIETAQEEMAIRRRTRIERGSL